MPTIAEAIFGANPGTSHGFGIGIVQIEYNPQSNEVKLQLGQGRIVAGTWSPMTGFGFQAGVGVDLKVAPRSSSRRRPT